MTFTPISLSSLKTIKNTVIGNPSAKVQLAQDEEFVHTLVQCLNDPPPSDSSEEDLRIEAAHVIASISYGSASVTWEIVQGSEAVLGTLLRCDAPQAFLYAIAKLTPEDPAPLRAALARGLRALAIAIADTVGPSQWGLREERSTIKPDAEAALEFIFQVSPLFNLYLAEGLNAMQTESLDLYLPLLADPASQTRISIAQLLGFAVRNAEHRNVVATWLPPNDRLKEVKTRRGWEKTATNANAPNRQGGWVCRNLTALIHSKDAKLQEAALWGLATIAKDNFTVAAVLTKSPTDRDARRLSLVTREIRAQSDPVLTILSATSIIRAAASAQPPHGLPPVDDASARTVMNVVNRIISAPGEPLGSRAKACFILYYLVTDHTALCFAAFDRGCLAKLAAVLRDITPTAPAAAEWEDDEPESVAALREVPLPFLPPSILLLHNANPHPPQAALTATAAIALFDNTIRRSVTDDLRLLPPIHAALAHRAVGVRYAACQCVRALSRAVAVLRTNIVDSGLGMAVFQIFKKEKGEDRRVTAAALAAVCNIVNEFSPLRPIYLDLGIMPRLVQLLGGGDATLRLSALWAVKNLLSKTSGETKRDVMQCLGWPRLTELFDDADGAVQEQAFHLVRNLAENEAGIEMIFREMGAPVLLAHLTAALAEDDDDVVLQATYVLANLANGAAACQAHLLAAPALLRALRGVLAERAPHIRRPAVSAVLELARTSTAGRRALGAAGVGGTLRQMCSASASARDLPAGAGAGAGGGAGGVGVGVGVGVSVGLRGTAMDDDRDVIEQARTALDWLEHGEAYSTCPIASWFSEDILVPVECNLAADLGPGHTNFRDTDEGYP
ncbi:ARM repeat-containing protein [Mycena vulgaris]|nr:ARM repeat-containing protein [Mycena vulgaris]